MSHKTTFMQTLMHLLNGYIGSGILAMPKAFSDGGIVISSIATPLFGILMNGCIHLLVRVNAHLCDKLCVAPMDYEDIAEKVLSNGPKFLQRFAKIARYIVMAFLISSQIGSCSVYNIFVADNLKLFFMNVMPSNLSSMSIEYYLLILFPFMVLLSFVKSIKHLSIASTLANLLQVAGLAIIVYNLVSDIPPVSSLTTPVGSKLPLFFSTTVFSFEVIKVAMPLYKTMEDPKSYGKPFGVLNIAIVIVTAFYFSIGFLGYVKYGDEVEASLTLSLPQEVIYDCVKFMYAVAVILTYPILLYGAIDMLWPLIKKRLVENKSQDQIVFITEYLFRTFLVLITFALAALIPNLELIIALVGAVVLSFIAIIFPPILHTITFWDETQSRPAFIWMCSRNCIIILFGILGFATGTYYSLKDIVHEFTEEDL